MVEMADIAMQYISQRANVLRKSIMEDTNVIIISIIYRVDSISSSKREGRSSQYRTIRGPV